MVQGLGFLSKKSWHTKNIANQEKVWLAEERQRAEELKTQELAKQIQQEKEQNELEELTGKKTTARDRGIDWMYDGANPASEIAREDAKKEAEEYLMGKEYVPSGPVKGDLNDDANDGVHAVVEAATTDVATEPSVQDRNEAFRMRHEDPMFAVARRAHQQEQKIIKKKELYDRVAGSSHDKRERKRKRKEDRRERKRDRKERRHKRERDNRRSSSDEEESDRHRKRRSRRSSSRSPSYGHSRRKDRRHRSWRDDSDESDDYRYDREKFNRHHKNSERHLGNGRYASDSECTSSERNTRKERQGFSHRDSRSPEEDAKHSSRRSGDSDNRKGLNDSKRSSSKTGNQKRAGYGLQAASSTLNTHDLGPSKDLLQRKRDKVEAERRQAREKASSRHHLSAEERAAALREMERDAQHRSHSRVRHGKVYEEDSSASNKRDGTGSFLNDVRKQAHGLDGNQTMSQRLRQNRNTNQKLQDGFL